VRIQRTSAYVELDDIYAQLRKLPFAQHVRRLIVGQEQLARKETDDYTRLFTVMVRDGLPSRLVELVLGDIPEPRLSRLCLGDVGAIVACAPSLETLRVLGGHGVTSPLSSQRLRVLELAGGLKTAAAAAPETASWTLPRLEELVLRDVNSPPTFLGGFPSLVRVEIAGAGRASGLVAWIADSELPCLREVTLARCELEDFDLDVAIQRADRLAKLDKLDLRWNSFSRAKVKQAKKSIPKLQAGGR
jgi:hypothetical protein